MSRLVRRWRSRPIGYVIRSRWYDDESLRRIVDTLDYS